MAFDLENILEQFEARAVHKAMQQGSSQILDGLSAYDVDICDLATLHRATGHEYALFGRIRESVEERILIRGEPYRVHIPSCFLDEDVIWYAHSHPNDDTVASPQDHSALQSFRRVNGQQRSVIVTIDGSCRDFSAHRDLANEINSIFGINTPGN